MFPSSINESSSFADSSLLRQIMWPLLQGREMVFLFVAISGFTLYLNYFQRSFPDVKRYLFRRVNRIIPVYLTSLCIGVIVVYFVNVLGNPGELDNLHFSVAGFLSHLFFLQHWNSQWIFQLNPPLWSISVEFQLYLVLPLIVFLMHKAESPLILLTIPIVSRAIQSRLFNGFFWFNEWFIAGIYVAVNYGKLIMRSTLSLRLAMALMWITAIYRPLHPFSIVWDYYFLCTVMVTIQFLMQNDFSLSTRLGKSMYWIGERSYSLYAIHFPILAITYTILKSKISLDLHATIYFLLLAPLMTFSAMHVLHSYVETNTKLKIFKGY